jgi:hypothetical protein
MPEIGTSGSMSGDGKRSAGLRAQATAPILDSTIASVHPNASIRAQSEAWRTCREALWRIRATRMTPNGYDAGPTGYRRTML